MSIPLLFICQAVTLFFDLLFLPTFQRQEMDSLQRQMEKHTITVHESMSSWTQFEEQLTDLTSSSFPAAGSDNQEFPIVDLKEHLHHVSEEELTQ